MGFWRPHSGKIGPNACAVGPLLNDLASASLCINVLAEPWFLSHLQWSRRRHLRSQLSYSPVPLVVAVLQPGQTRLWRPPDQQHQHRHLQSRRSIRFPDNQNVAPRDPKGGCRPKVRQPVLSVNLSHVAQGTHALIVVRWIPHPSSSSACLGSTRTEIA